MTQSVLVSLDQKELSPLFVLYFKDNATSQNVNIFTVKVYFNV